MSDILAKHIVRCPVNQADRQVSLFFKKRGNADGSIARLELHVDVPVALERPALATISARHDPADMLPSYAVSWAAENGGPYPTFIGSLRIGAMDDYDAFELILAGRYEPPLGVVGAGFDKVVGHRIAVSMAQHLLASIAGDIEASFAEEERVKATHAR